MSPRRTSFPAVSLALALTLAGEAACDPVGVPGGGPLPVFTLGSITFRASSGGFTRSATGLTLYLSDQVDVCQAIAFVPLGTSTLFQLAVAPAADGTTLASVVSPRPSPAPGEAEGTLLVSTGGVPGASLATASGSVAWTENAAGTVTVSSIDVGFAGIADRLAGAGWTLRACP